MRGGAGTARHLWLLVVIIAAGLVGMHHLVHAHTVPMTVASATHADPHPPGGSPVEERPTSTSVVTSRVSCCDPMDMVGHLCLAVLTTIAALAAALTYAAARCRPLEQGHLPAAAGAVAARAPPLGSVPLSQLCVLRR